MGLDGETGFEKFDGREGWIALAQDARAGLAFEGWAGFAGVEFGGLGEKDGVSGDVPRTMARVCRVGDGRLIEEVASGQGVGLQSTCGR